MPNEKSEVDKAIDNVSGSTNRNERVGAVVGATVATFFAPTPAAAVVGARVGAATAHGAQQVEKSLHQAGKDISKLNPCKRW